MERNITTADYLKAAEIMAGCNEKNIDLVVYFLNKGGLCDYGFMELVEKRKGEIKPEARGRKKVIDPEFMALLEKICEIDDGDLKIFSSAIGVQKSRVYSWMKGERGITEDNKKYITNIAESYLKGRKIAKAKIQEQIDAMKLK